MLIVGIDAAAVETALTSGRLSCPNCVSGLRPWGHSVEREVRLLDRSESRRFRRSICRACTTTTSSSLRTLCCAGGTAPRSSVWP